MTTQPEPITTMPQKPEPSDKPYIPRLRRRFTPRRKPQLVRLYGVDIAPQYAAAIRRAAREAQLPVKGIVAAALYHYLVEL